MAPKRSAQPPPPAASSDETTSGSGSEEEEEEEIAQSTPPAAPKRIPPPPQEEQESEGSDEDEDGEEEDDEEEEEEEDEKANHVAPSSATKNPPPQPPTREESKASDDDEEEEEEEEEEEADDEVPQTKPAPNQEVGAKDAKRKGARFQRTWSTDDEFRVLEALAAHRQEHGTLPQTDVLADALAGKLENSGCSLHELQNRVKSLQIRYSKAVKKGTPPSKGEDRRLFLLSKKVWPSVTKALPNGGAGRDPEEMCELYPYLADEVKALQKAYPGMFKREFAMISDSKASALNEKIKKQKHVQMKLHLRRNDLMKEVTKTLMDLAD